jgi:hypothetical protein
MKRARTIGLSWLLAAGCSAALAQGIADPTKPPPAFMPGASTPSRVEQRAEASGSGSEPVQLVLVGKTRRYALVNGELVGDKTPGTKLVEVKRNELVVQTDKGRETLNLFPDVQKTPPKKRAGMGKKE